MGEEEEVLTLDEKGLQGKGGGGREGREWWFGGEEEQGGEARFDPLFVLAPTRFSDLPGLNLNGVDT